MSTELESPSIESPDSPPHYRTVSLWAVLSVACAAGTVMMFVFGWPMVFFPVAAIFFGRRALLKIQRLPDEYTGKQVAEAGIWSGAALGVGLSIWLLLGGLEVPHGYRVLDYSELEPTANDKGQLSATARELSDKATKVYIRGYMLPPLGGRVMGLTKFSICNSSHQCMFVQNLVKPSEEIHVELTGDRTVNYTSHQIGVGGKLTVRPDLGPGYYLIEADYTYP